MILLALNFIKHYWFGAVAGTLVLLISFQHMEISHLHAKITQGEAERVALSDSNRQLVASVQYQNAAIAKLKAESVHKSRQVMELFVKARSVARQYAIAAAHIQEQKMSGEHCADMKLLLSRF